MRVNSRTGVTDLTTKLGRRTSTILDRAAEGMDFRTATLAAEEWETIGQRTKLKVNDVAKRTIAAIGREKWVRIEERIERSERLIGMLRK